MCLHNISFSIDILTATITAVGIFLAYKGLESQLDFHNTQLKVEIFSDYSTRYQNIIADFPEGINEQSFLLTNLKTEDYSKTMRKMRQYYDLCFEEWFLNSKGLLEPSFWELWSGGMTTALSKPAFVDAWRSIKSTSVYGKDFENFIGQKIDSVN